MITMKKKKEKEEDGVFNYVSANFLVLMRMDGPECDEEPEHWLILFL